MTSWAVSTKVKTATSRQTLLVGLALTVFIVVNIGHLVNDYRMGGHRWKQADWLINNHGGWIRRGPIGSVLISISDVLHLDILMVVLGVQLAMLLTLVAGLAVTLMNLAKPTAYWLVVTSPCFFLILYTADPTIGPRKEMLGFTACTVLLAAHSLPKYARHLTIASLVSFALAVIGHEANVLLAPAFLTVLALALTSRGHSLRTTVHVAAGVLMVCGAAVLYALSFAQIESADACQPLLDRGLETQMCHGSIAWLNATTGNGIAGMKEMVATGHLSTFGLSYLLGTLPIAYLIMLHSHRRKLALVYVLIALPLLPLYPVAFDWGRWMGMHVASFAFVLLGLVQADRVKLVRTPDRRIVAVCMIAALLWAPGVGINFMNGGIAGTVLRLLTQM